MKTYNQQSDDVKKLYEDQYGDVKGGGERFYQAYTNSMRGAGEYSNVYDEWTRERDKAYGDLKAKYGGGNQIDYKNFDDEKLIFCLV